VVRTYARIAGVIFLAVAVVGFLIFGWERTSIFYHAGVGLFYLYVMGGRGAGRGRGLNTLYDQFEAIRLRARPFSYFLEDGR
jgi:hypothetical protein